MSLRLALVPAGTWLLAATLGRGLIVAPPERLWRGLQPFRTDPPPYDAAHRHLITGLRMTGWMLVALALFVTVMAVMVATGLVPPAAS